MGCSKQMQVVVQYITLVQLEPNTLTAAWVADNHVLVYNSRTSTDHRR
jgi:hypothetical protein